MAKNRQIQAILLFPLIILLLIILWLLAGDRLVNLFTRGRQDEPAQTVIDPNELKITNKLDGFVQDADGCLVIRYIYTITYTGTVPAENVAATSRFTQFYAGKFEVVNFTTGDGLSLNPNFDGDVDKNLLAADTILQPGDVKRINLSVKVCDYDPAVQFVNFVEISGTAETEEVVAPAPPVVPPTPTPPPPAVVEPPAPPVAPPPVTPPGPPAPVPPPPPPIPPEQVVGELLLSLSPNRSNPVGADGYVVEEGVPLYVFLETNTFPPAEFYINGVLVQTENFGPWDLRGGQGNANPWNPDEGTYVIEVRFAGKSLFATITVTAKSEVPTPPPGGGEGEEFLYDSDQVTFEFPSASAPGGEVPPSGVGGVNPPTPVLPIVTGGK